jgi:hypothetical protein
VFRRSDAFGLLVCQQPQELLASSFVVVRLRAEQSSENGNSLLMNELFR